MFWFYIQDKDTNKIVANGYVEDTFLGYVFDFQLHTVASAFVTDMFVLQKIHEEPESVISMYRDLDIAYFEEIDPEKQYEVLIEMAWE